MTSFLKSFICFPANAFCNKDFVSSISLGSYYVFIYGNACINIFVLVMVYSTNILSPRTSSLILVEIYTHFYLSVTAHPLMLLSRRMCSQYH